MRHAKNIFLYTCFILLFYTITFASDLFEFQNLPDLPPLDSGQQQKGVAGSFSGISYGKLLIAGGANFPRKSPWQAGEKVYYDNINVLFLDGIGEEQKWFSKTFKLPAKVGYGASIQINDEIICIGGHNSETTFNNVFSIKWDPEKQDVLFKNYPSLPTPLTLFSAVLLNNNVYVLGGANNADGLDSEKHFYRLNLDQQNTPDFSWQKLPGWPGEARILPVSVVQSNGLVNCIYLFSGRNINEQGGPKLHYDGFVYNPALEQWSTLGNNSTIKFPVMAGNAFSSGSNNIIFMSGDTGKLMLESIQLNSKIAAAANTQTKTSLEKELADFLNSHPGFSRDILVYNTITNSIYNAGKVPFSGQVTTNIIPYQDGFIIPSGEIRPGVRTTKINFVKVHKVAKSFGALNSFVLFIYIVVLVWMGWFFSKRQKNTNDYFKGGGRVPWWAAGLSLFGTALSAITFMAIPAKTYATNWAYFMYNMGIILVAPLIILLFVPYYRKLNITTAYEFLELRFNLITRLIGSLSFMFFQIGRMGIVLFLPSIALNVVTGIDIFFCILLMGLFALLYTSMGGIEAVIWTDVLQVIVLMGGALLSVILIIVKVPNGFFGIIHTGAAQSKFEILNFVFDLKQPYLWTVLIGTFFANILTYGTDQTMVQRYLTVKNQKAAEKSVWTNAVMSTIATLLFFFIGTALFVFYQNFPQQAAISINEADAIFPWYIITQLPAGLSGLLIAGIFAAAMSSLSSSINSAATAYINDFHARFARTKSLDSLIVAKWASVFFGLAGIVFAIFMATWDIKSLWDEFSKVLGLILGGLGGVFLLGILSKRANGIGALGGIVIASIVQYLVAVYQPVHFLLFTATGVISCYIGGYFVSIIVPQKSKFGQLF